MPRAVERLAPGRAPAAPADTLILTSEERRSQRATVTTSKGTQIEFDFAEPVTLATDDLLLLDNGDVVEVVAAAEPLIELRADLATLARIAWALGDRHVPVQILPNRIRLRSDHAHAHAPLVASFGAKPVRIEAPFEPEGGAYAPGAHDHQHAHDDARHHHEHGHGRLRHHHGHGDHDHAHGRGSQTAPRGARPHERD